MKPTTASITTNGFISHSNNAPFKKVLNNNELLIEDFDENNDETLYETPFVSFMNHSADDLDVTPVARKYVPQQIVNKGLLEQGILDASCNSQNDLTPTVEINNNKKDDVLNRARNLEKL